MAKSRPITTAEDILRKGFVPDGRGGFMPAPKDLYIHLRKDEIKGPVILDERDFSKRNLKSKIELKPLPIGDHLTNAEGRKLLKMQAGGKYPESKLQQRCVSWFRNEGYPQYKWLLYAIPNGGYRKKSTAKILNAEGALSGAWDLFLSIPNIDYHGLYIEMKIKPNKLTENQDNFRRQVLSVGYYTAVCYTFEEFRIAVINYLL